MPESMLLAAAVGVVAGALAVGLVLGLRRIVASSKELGTDAERATYETLHLAARAGAHLRGGFAAGHPGRAARYLRTLLGAETLALTGPDGMLAVDGDAALAEVAERLAREDRGAARTQVHHKLAVPGGETDAVVAPILAGGERVGTLVAFASRARSGIVRATGEVADWVAVQLELGELEASRAALAEAEVKALRSQISPHFIYNSLNAIASFIHTDPVRARELVLEFADFTRYSFRRHGDFTTVAEELRSIDSYLRLERARFGDRLQVSLRIAPEVLPAIVPFLSIQPLVENAVRHGLERKEGGGRITITAADQGGFAAISVEDDGVGIDPARLADILAGGAPGEHVGVRNVDARLRQVYGDEHGLVIETALGAGTLVRMRVPKSQPLRGVGPALPQTGPIARQRPRSARPAAGGQAPGPVDPATAADPDPDPRQEGASR